MRAQHVLSYQLNTSTMQQYVFDFATAKLLCPFIYSYLESLRLKEREKDILKSIIFIAFNSEIKDNTENVVKYKIFICAVYGQFVTVSTCIAFKNTQFYNVSKCLPLNFLFMKFQR